jgi:hypothetical protein
MQTKNKKERLEDLKDLKQIIKEFKDKGQTGVVERLEWVYGQWERELEYEFYPETEQWLNT